MLGGDPEAWHTQAAAARELEALVEHMMNTKFRIHLRLSDFVGEMLMHVFGGVKEITALHLTLAPPEHGEGQGQQRLVSMGRRPGSGWFERAQAAGVAGAGANNTTPPFRLFSHPYPFCNMYFISYMQSFDVSLCGWIELTLRKHEHQENHLVHRKTIKYIQAITIIITTTSKIFYKAQAEINITVPLPCPSPTRPFVALRLSGPSCTLSSHV
jgi:hypothetical protein